MKRVFLSFLFHGNMNYDRYPKSIIRDKFPEIYRITVDAFEKYPELRGCLQLSGMTIESLKIVDPELLSIFRGFVKEGRLSVTGTYYSEPVNMCTDGETDFKGAWLGTEIVKRELGEPEGFFPQEQSYHPQMPWLIQRLGLSWVTVGPDCQPPEPIHPFRLRGADGTVVIGVPVIHLGRRSLEEWFDLSRDNGLLVAVSDFEMPFPFDRIVESIRELSGRGKKFEFITVGKYLKEFPGQISGDEVFVPVHAWQTENRPQSPSFSRWVSDPQDIALHEVTKRAMTDVVAAHTLSLLAEEAVAECQKDYLASGYGGLDVTLEDDAITDCIDTASEFPKVEDYLTQFCAGGFSGALAKAWHLLLWAVNSDARGWYPLPERRRERMISLQNASTISRGIIDRCLFAFGGIGAGRDRDIRRRSPFGLLVYNPRPSREVFLDLELGIPYRVLSSDTEGISSFNYMKGGVYHTQLVTRLPSYGISFLGLEPEKKYSTFDWEQGNAISNGAFSIETKGSTVYISDGREPICVRLEPFIVRDPSGSTSYIEPENVSGIITGVRFGLYPELRLAMRLTWNIFTEAIFRLEENIIMCSWRFEFLRPTFVGEGGWSPRGLIISVSREPGKVFYDVPFAVCEYPDREWKSKFPSTAIGDEVGFIAALRFVTLESQGGVALISTGGAQSFNVDPKRGKIGICLGASTTGGPAIPPSLEVDRHRGHVRHFDQWEDEIFYGDYHHAFAIVPYDSSWRSAGIPRLARDLNEPPYVLTSADIGGGEVANNISLLSIEGNGIELSSLERKKEGIVARLYETHGTGGAFSLQCVGGRQVDGTIDPYEIKEVFLR